MPKGNNITRRDIGAKTLNIIDILPVPHKDKACGLLSIMRDIISISSNILSKETITEIDTDRILKLIEELSNAAAKSYNL